jgi:hypothetical protein
MKLKTSYNPPFVFSGVKPSAKLQAPNESVSISRVRFSSTAKLAARFTAVVVFPTPPFGIAIVIILAKASFSEISYPFLLTRTATAR